MTEMYQQNTAIIQSRWPMVADFIAKTNIYTDAHWSNDGPSATLMINGLHVGSCYNPAKEARLQAKLVASHERFAWVYGVGMGELVQNILSREKIERVDLAVIDPGVMLLLIKELDCRQWLGDPRLNMVLPNASRAISKPFCVVPTALKLCHPDFYKVRDQLLLELNTPYVNKRITANKEFIQQIKDNIETVKTDHDVSALFSSNSSKDFVVVGAGPSLAKSADKIRVRREELMLIAADAALKPLESLDITADVVISVDGNEDWVTRFIAPHVERYRDKPLVYFPVVAEKAIKLWQGPRYAAYSQSPLYKEISEKVSRGILFASGTVVHTAVDLAYKMGAKTIMLAGIDLAYPGGKSHAETTENKRALDMRNRHYWVKNGHDRLIPSDPNFIGYLRDLEHYIKVHPKVKFINLSRDGAKIEGAAYDDHE